MASSSSTSSDPVYRCDGSRENKCVEARHVGGKIWICPHYNAATIRPDLLPYFYPDLNDGKELKDFYLSSKVSITWRCSNCVSGDNECHTWVTSLCWLRELKYICPFCEGKKPCAHANSLESNFPAIASQWHPDNTGKPKDYSPFSSKKVLWICNGCRGGHSDCHQWIESISNRTRQGLGCPWCSGKKGRCPHDNNLLIMHPVIAYQWHPDNSGNPEDYSSFSKVKVKWICYNCPSEESEFHVWESTISHRIKQGEDCPYSQTLEGRFPELAAQWHPTKNRDLERPFPHQYSCGSGVRVWWLCPNCPGGSSCHEWEAAIYSRAQFKGNGCPVCAGRKLCEHSDTLETKFPEIWKQLHPDDRKAYFPYSQKVVRWKCKMCPSGDEDCHQWEASIDSRSFCNIEGICPFCIRHRICEHMGLTSTHPEIVKNEWDYERNKISPDDISFGSTSIRCYWLCPIPECRYSYRAYPSDRFRADGRGSGCPRCASSKGEKVTLEILKSRVESINREDRLLKELPNCRFDFFCPKINLIIEYDGVQHFIERKTHWTSSRSFAEGRRVDILKHLLAISDKYQYQIIRIDHSIPLLAEDIKFHIECGMNEANPSYYSTPELYQWLIEPEKAFLKIKDLLTPEQQIEKCKELAEFFSSQTNSIVLEEPVSQKEDEFVIEDEDPFQDNESNSENEEEVEISKEFDNESSLDYDESLFDETSDFVLDG